MRPWPGIALGLFVMAASGRARAQDPCDPSATVSPCFDADALWLPTGATHFVSVPSPRPLARGAPTLSFGAGLALRPAILEAPSPDPEGREIGVVRATTTLTIGVGFGLGHGFGITTSLPFVPYQEGTGAEGVTSQRAAPLASAAVRDPRAALWFTALGAEQNDPFALAGRLELAAPLGDEELLAGSRSTTLAPAVTLELDADRFVFGADLGVRLRSAVDFGTVRQGSEAVLGAGGAVRLLSAPRLLVGVEAWLRPGLAGTPPGADPESRDLPAEWLASGVFAWEAESPWSLAAGAGSGLPLSRARDEVGDSESFAGVTAPAFRAVLALRFAPPEPR